MTTEFALKPDERQAFDVYFASVTSMQFHPGAGTREHRKLTLAECCDVAVAMIEQRRSVQIEEN